MLDIAPSGDLETTDLFVEEIFVKQPSPDAPPKLTPNALKVLSLTNPVLSIPEDAICQIASLSEEESTQSTVTAAEGIYRADPVRTAKLRLCDAGIKGLRKAMVLAEEIRASAWRDVKGSPVEEMDRAASRSRWGLWVLPPVLALGISFLFGALSLLVCEPTNGLVLLDLSGHLEGYATAVKLALVSVPSMLVYMVTWGLLSLLKPSTAKRTALAILLILLPIAVLTAFLFAMKMSADMNPDPFNPEPFPPFWIVVFLFMMSSAGTAVCSKLLIRRVICRPLGIELKESVDLLFHSDRAMRWDIRSEQCELLAAQFQSVIDDLEAERAAFVAQCLAELAGARKYVADQVNAAADEARRRVTPIPRCLQTRSRDPHRNGQTDGSLRPR
ncbi:MAG: hypothetical protein KDB00_26490 [Planctomycetales bacterium]|nr:hypothetical protein [Planctomycetales bacterium]MCA9200038.1 hypothetical protein [Planctomycetales bacterium]